MKTLRLLMHNDIDEFIGGHYSTTPNESGILAYLASEVPNGGVIVEIGAYVGRTSCYMASVLKANAELICVDPWNIPTLPGIYEKFLKNIEHFGFTEVITPIRDTSENAAKTFNKKIDFLFIDGDHHYNGVKTDFEKWYGFVKPGGIVAFHDYDNRSPERFGVKKFIDGEMNNRLKLIEISEKLWIGRK